MPGKGTTVTLMTAEEHATRRRANKASRRANGNKHAHSEGYLAGLERERDERLALAFMDALNHKMCSASPTIHVILRDAFQVFMESFVSVTNDELRRSRQFRYQVALDHAIKGITEQAVANYMRSAVNVANSQVRRSQQAAYAN